MKHTHILVIAASLFSICGFSQTTASPIEPDRAFRVEVEPTAYFAKGWSVFASYGVNQTRNLHIGLYSMASSLPKSLNETFFKKATKDDEIRLKFEIALSVRYKFQAFKNTESNPYVGLFLGWEKFEHTNALTNQKTEMTNMFATPQFGYEIYVYHQMIYLDPNFRIVYEFGRNSNYTNASDPNDAGPTIKDFLFLPSFSIGIRF